MSRFLYVSLLVTVAAAAGFWGRGKVLNRVPVAPVLAVVEPPRALTEWFYADGLVNPAGKPTPSREWIVLYNPGDLPANAAVTFFFERREPVTISRLAPPHAGISVAVQDVIPADLHYGVRVRSDRMLIVQPSRGEYFPGNPVTQAMASFVAYPGPLGKRETKWAYADGLILKNDEELEELEWVSILNPSESRAATVTLRFETGGHATTHPVTVDAQRAFSVDLFRLASFPKNKLVGVTVESDVPIVVEQVRRAYKKGDSAIAALWACLAFPIGGM
jgi:hypothetical protein